MRAYERFEWYKEKCMICGCRNKVYSELLENITDRYIGFSLKCCACGHLRMYFNERSYNGRLEIPKYHIGKQECCRRQACPFRKRCMLWDRKVVPPDDGGFKPDDTPFESEYKVEVEGYDLGVPDSYHSGCPYRNENSNSVKLVVNISDEDNFI